MQYLDKSGLEYFKQKIFDKIDEVDSSWWIDYVTISAGTTITNGYSISWTKGLNYEPTPDYPYIQNLYVFWNGNLLKKKSSVDTDGHYTEADSNTSAYINLYRTSGDGSYTVTEDVLVTIIGKTPN